MCDYQSDKSHVDGLTSLASSSKMAWYALFHLGAYSALCSLNIYKLIGGAVAE